MSGVISVADGNRGARRALMIFLALGFVSLLAMGAAAAWNVGRTQVHTRAVNHTYEVELAVADLRRIIEEGETTRRGLLVAPRAESFFTAYQKASAALPPAVDRLAVLTSDNPRQRGAIAVLRADLADQVALRERSVALVRTGNDAAAIAQFGAEVSARRMRHIRDTLTGMTAEERRLLRSRDAEQRGSTHTFYLVLGLAGVLLVVVAIATVLTLLRYTRDLASTSDRLRDLNETLEDQVAERTADLTRANEEIQRFAYIVSHDLRAPLVNVMGFTAELEGATTTLRDMIDRAEERAPAILTEDARLAAREDLPEAIGFIRTSTQKMDRLINAILKLSREGRRVITPEPLDLAAMVETIAATLAHRLDEVGATLTIQRPLPALTSDRLAVEQVMSNLIENAVKYLQAGRPGRVTVSGETLNGRVRVRVSDNGRGIDPRDHARVFDLFRRSGAQDQPGEGIGLAHVRALMQRLGGSVDMMSELGQGATFTLSLPVSFQEPQDRP